VYETMNLVVFEQRRDAARGGIEPPDESVAGGAQETRCLPMSFDRGVGADGGWWPHPQVLQDAQKSRPGQEVMMS
jgi:hypothetical protein